MLEKVLGIIRFDAPTYRAVATDAKAIQEAGILVITVALLQELAGKLASTFAFHANIDWSKDPFSLFLNVILGLVVWTISAWLLFLTAQAFGGRANLGELIRITGFVQIFGLINLLVLIAPASSALNLFVAFALALLNFIGYIVGLKEAAGFSWRKAFVAASFAMIAIVGIAFLIVKTASVVIPLFSRKIG